MTDKLRAEAFSRAVKEPDVQEIAAMICVEMVDAAKSDGCTFDDEQLGFVEQALSDAAQEAINRLAAEGAISSPASQFTENEIKDVLTALYQDGHVDLVLADRIAALLKGPVRGACEDAQIQSSQSTDPLPWEPTRIDDAGDLVCKHGTAMDVHCCDCHSGFLFDSRKCTCF